MKRPMLFFLTVAGRCSLWALDSRVAGTTLLETMDARAAALGEAGTTLPGDLSGTAFNPALWPTVKQPQLETQFQVAPGDVHTALVSYGRSSSVVGWGVTCVGLDAGRVEAVSSGISSSKKAQQDVVGALSAGWAVVSGLQVGGTLKGIHSRLAATEGGSALAADVGIVMKVPFWPGLRWGGSVQNIGSALRYRSQEDPLPLFYRGGISYQWAFDIGDDASASSLAWGLPDSVSHSEVWVGADAVFDRWGNATGHVGLEWAQGRVAVLRVGGIVGKKGGQPTAGVGFLIRQWRLDYAIEWMDALTDRHRVTVSYFWKDD